MWEWSPMTVGVTKSHPCPYQHTLALSLACFNSHKNNISCCSCFFSSSSSFVHSLHSWLLKKARDPVVLRFFLQINIYSLGILLWNLDPSLLQIISINNVDPPIILAPNTTLGSGALFPCQEPPWEVMHYPLVQKLSENRDKNNQMTPMHITDCSGTFLLPYGGFLLLPLVTMCV